MKHLKSLLIIVLFLPLSLFAQGWQLFNTGFNYILTDISFPGNQSQIGYAVGESSTYNGTGIILKTTNGGDTWTQLSTGSIPGLETCCFLDVNTGFVGGWQNYYAKTTDGGLTWTTSVVNSSIWYIHVIRFYDALHGMVCAPGYSNYITSDGGLSWSAVTLNTNVEGLDYASSTIVYAAGSDLKIAKSTDGGNTWTMIVSGGAGSYYLGVDFINPNYGIVSGENGSTRTTTDGGSTWTISTAGPGGDLLHAVHVYSTDSALVAGTPEAVHKTINSGVSWTTEYPSAGNFALYKIAVAADNTQFICGSQGKILRKKSNLQASFTASQQNACIVASIFFTATNALATSWQWSFPGGSPSTSNLQNPVPITYSTPGYYDVQLIVSNGIITDTLLMPNYLHILLPATPSISGSNVAGEFNPNTYSTTNNPGNTYTWVVTGGSITSGANTNQITVQWGAAGPGTIDLTETNAGCISYASLSVTITQNIGIQENPGMQCSIFPNPSSGIYVINANRPLKRLQLCDMNGKTINTIDLKSSTHEKIDISQLKSGSYLLIIEDIAGGRNTITIKKID
ncbi:MAG: T9SS type A sorting domain-containing protein [Bacteroidota bacterium]